MVCFPPFPRIHLAKNCIAKFSCAANLVQIKKRERDKGMNSLSWKETKLNEITKLLTKTPFDGVKPENKKSENFCAFYLFIYFILFVSRKASC